MFFVIVFARVVICLCLDLGGAKEEPGEEPEGARRSKEESAGTRRSQEEPAGARRT